MDAKGSLADGRLKAIAEWALRQTTPLLEQIITENGKRPAFAISVLDDGNNEVANWEFNREQWENGRDYHAYAQGKAQASMRVGLDSRYISPQSWMPGEFPNPGAIIYDGFAVAGSGVQPELDEICARIVGEVMMAAIYGDFFKMTTAYPGILPAT